MRGRTLRRANTAGDTPWDLARDNETLKDSDAYWRLNDLRFEARE